MRLSNTFLPPKTAYAGDSLAPVIDASKGGQFGLMTDMDYLVSATPYVQRNMVCYLVEAPRGFDLMPNPEVMRSTLKAFVELQAKSVDLGNTKLTVESADTPFGGDGNKLEAPTNVTRGVPEPSFVHMERAGRPFTKFLTTWVTFLIMDPITKIPSVVTLPQNKGRLAEMDMLPDFYGMTCLFFEPDPFFRRIEKAWLCANMYPKETPDEIGKMDKTAAGDTLEFTTPFTALTMQSYAVKVMAQQLLDEMNLTGANPNYRPAFIDKITPDVKAASGFNQKIAEAASKVVQP